ncbi:MAG: hypothetical protein Q9188_003898 [Gyalolechia gomerana]
MVDKVLKLKWQQDLLKAGMEEFKVMENDLKLTRDQKRQFIDLIATYEMQTADWECKEEEDRDAVLTEAAHIRLQLAQHPTVVPLLINDPKIHEIVQNGLAELRENYNRLESDCEQAERRIQSEIMARERFVQFESMLNDMESLKLTAEDERTAFEEKATALQEDLLEQRNLNAAQQEMADGLAEDLRRKDADILKLRDQNAAQEKRATELHEELSRTEDDLSEQRARNAAQETLINRKDDQIVAQDRELAKKEGYIEAQAKVIADLLETMTPVTTSPDRSSPQAQGQSSLLQQASEAWKSAHNKRPSDPVLAQSPRRRSSKRRKSAHTVVEPDRESSEAPSPAGRRRGSPQMSPLARKKTSGASPAGIPDLSSPRTRLPPAQTSPVPITRRSSPSKSKAQASKAPNEQLEDTSDEHPQLDPTEESSGGPSTSIGVVFPETSPAVPGGLEMHFDVAAVWNQIRLAGSQWDADARKRLLEYLESFRVKRDEKDHPPNALDHCAKSKGPVCFKSYAQHKPSGFGRDKDGKDACSN